MDCALLLFLKSFGVSPATFRQSHDDVVLQQFEFNSQKKRMDTILKNGMLLSKGAPEIILNNCNKYIDVNFNAN